MKAKAMWILLRDTCLEWYMDRGARLGAALAYYTVFSLAPLLIITLSIATLVFEQEAVQRHILKQISELVGADGAKAIRTMLERAQRPTSGMFATAIGLVTLLFGATLVFGELQDALNTIWKAPPRAGRGLLLGILRERLLAFVLVLGMGCLLLLSLVLSTVLLALNELLRALIPRGVDLLRIGNMIFLFSVVTLLSAMIYKVLPEIKIAWSDVLIGAIMTAVLFLIGKVLIGLYLGVSKMAWGYGAAGSLVIILVWVYYSAQILYFGAEFTKVYANRYGSRRCLP
ncbi:MAG: YihY/virulence factor BrkB family protein [Nitrospinae bacterium]|nr:YihY/virulence factor BrkB family protein [Nitrospinota bacterium]